MRRTVTSQLTSWQERNGLLVAQCAFGPVDFFSGADVRQIAQFVAADVQFILVNVSVSLYVQYFDSVKETHSVEFSLSFLETRTDSPPPQKNVGLMRFDACLFTMIRSSCAVRGRILKKTSWTTVTRKVSHILYKSFFF